VRVGPVELTGQSSNLYFYGEKDRRDGYLWAEVLVASWERGRPLVPRKIPRFYVTVRRQGEGVIAETKWEPARTPKTGHGALDPGRVRSLMQEAVDGLERRKTR
jgi:hypothetical protein